MAWDEISAIAGKGIRRLFCDRRLVFSGIILPALLIALTYTVLGSSVSRLAEIEDGYRYRIAAVNAPDFFRDSLPEDKEFSITDIPETDIWIFKNFVADKSSDLLIWFGDRASGTTVYGRGDSGAPQIQIWHNSGRLESAEANAIAKDALRSHEREYARLFDVNAVLDADEYDLNDGMSFAALMAMSMMPMILIMSIYSGCSAIATESVAGEKERGTLAMLLVTPARRSSIAIGKIISVALFAMASSGSSFAGIMLSMPALLSGMSGPMQSVIGAAGYMAMLAVTASTSLMIISALCVISAFAKSVREAHSYAMPLSMACFGLGGSSLYTGSPLKGTGWYLIPVLNSSQAFASVLKGSADPADIAVTVIANMAIAALCAWLLAKLLGNEKAVSG